MENMPDAGLAIPDEKRAGYSQRDWFTQNRIWLAVVTLMLLVLSGVTLPKLEWDDDLEAAQKAAETFHRKVSAGDYDAIYDGLSDNLKATTSRERIRDLFQQFGTCEAASLVDGSYAMNN